MILLTGATDFVGGGLIRRLVADRLDQRLVVATRKAEGVWPAHVLPFAVGDLLPNTDWSDPLRGVLKMVHAAARAHVMADKSADPLAEFQRVMWMVL